MLVACPRCKTRYRIDDGKVAAEGVKLRCGSCSSVFRVPRPAPAPEVPSATNAATAKQAVVFVVHESAAFCEAVRKVLAPEPFRVVCFNDGNDAFIAVRNQKPEVALLDVPLPGRGGYEICEALKGAPATAATKLILISPAQDKAGHERSRDSLCGADDFIERHRIPTDLAAKIYTLLSAPSGSPAAATANIPAAPAAAPGAPVPAPPVPREIEPPPASAAPENLSEDHVKARRLARIIASDIALYNPAKVEEGVRSGTFFDLLAEEVAEGRALYARRVPEDVRAATDYLNDAFAALITRKTSELRTR